MVYLIPLYLTPWRPFWLSTWPGWGSWRRIMLLS